MGKVISINISPERGTEKMSIKTVKIIEGWGLEGDAHGGDWDKQVSIFPIEAMEKIPAHKKQEVLNGGYTENITVSGIDPDDMKVGTIVKIGEAEIKILHVGKEEFKEHSRPYIVSREGRFGRVVKSGIVCIDDEIEVVE